MNTATSQLETKTNPNHMPITHDADRIATQIALAMYGSDRTVETLPVMRTWHPWEVVCLTAPASVVNGGDL